jgi:cytochrome c5
MRTAVLCLSLLTLATPALAETPLTQRLQEGKAVYARSCASCHDAGTDGAPMLSRPDQWSERSDLWEGVLFEHAREGIGKMPGKGGDQALPTADMEAAAEYILSVVYPDRTTD